MDERPMVTDKIYEGPIDYEEIKDNPILQPISEIKSNYESHSQMVVKATIDFDEIKKRIDKMIEDNPVYSECIIIAEFKDLIRNAKDIIHSQDLQRDFLKQTINKMVSISGKYYEVREKEIREEFPYKEIQQITDTGQKRGRPKKIIPEEVTDGK